VYALGLLNRRKGPPDDLQRFFVVFPMSLASAMNVLRPTLPYYVALTRYGLLRINDHSFECHLHPAAPPLALEMAKAVFTMGASSCVESYVMSRMLSEGAKVFAFDTLTCEVLEEAGRAVRSEHL
jgi:hypothetical protein